MQTKRNTKTKTHRIQDSTLLVKFESFNYNDFTSDKEIKSKCFLLINNALQDKRILTTIEEVKFAGKYIENPIILGFRCLADAKTYLAGPRLPAPGKKEKPKEFYSHKPHEQKSTIKEARRIHEEFVNNFNKG